MNSTTELEIATIYKNKLIDEEFQVLSDYIQRVVGIKMPEIKRVMLQGRLYKRLKELKVPTFKEYINYAFARGNEEEQVKMINVISTNKTDFFREPVHFDYLKKEFLPEFIANNLYKVIRVWSAGCSSGEEPYSIAITISEFLKRYPEYDFTILGSDISNVILRKSVNAIYPEERLTDVADELKKKYFLRSEDRINPAALLIPEIRRKVSWMRLNLMDNEYKVRDFFDVIFCRNVMIYFNRADQEKIINKLCNNLKTNGLFILGHSESIMNMKVPLKQIKPTIFRKI